jgi:hypothetical protein
MNTSGKLYRHLKICDLPELSVRQRLWKMNIQDD